jgi:hypothetical protein
MRALVQHARPLSSSVGGEGGIRTHESLAALPVFETGPFNRSGTSPIAAIVSGEMKPYASDLVPL